MKRYELLMIEIKQLPKHVGQSFYPFFMELIDDCHHESRLPQPCGKISLMKLGYPQAVTEASVCVPNYFLSFYQHLLFYPSQWKGWLLVHHDIQPVSLNLKKGMRTIGYPDYMPYSLSDQYFYWNGRHDFSIMLMQCCTNTFGMIWRMN